MKPNNISKKSSFRREKIGVFYKTEHFLLRQWERKISDEILLFALKTIPCSKERTYIIVSRKITSKKLGVNCELFILKDGKNLVTCFLTKIETFKSSIKRKQNYLIINE